MHLARAAAAHGIDARATARSLRLLRRSASVSLQSREATPPRATPWERPRVPGAIITATSAIAGARSLGCTRSSATSLRSSPVRRYSASAATRAPSSTDPSTASPPTDGDHHFQRHPEFIALAEEYGNNNNEHIEHLLDSVASARLQPLSDDELRGIGSLLSALGYGVSLRGPDGAHIYMRRLAESVAAVHGAAFVNDPSQYDLEHFKQRRFRPQLPSSSASASTSAARATAFLQDVSSTFKAVVEGATQPSADGAAGEEAGPARSVPLLGADDGAFGLTWDSAFEDFLLATMLERVAQHRAARAAAAEPHSAVTPVVLFVGNGCLARALINDANPDKLYAFLRALEEVTADRGSHRAPERPAAAGPAPAEAAPAPAAVEKGKKGEEGARGGAKKGARREKAKSVEKRKGEPALEERRARLAQALRELEARTGVAVGSNWRVMVVGSATVSDSHGSGAYGEEDELDEEDVEEDEGEDDIVMDAMEDSEWRQRRSNNGEMVLINLSRGVCPQEVSVLPPAGSERAARWAERLARDEKEEIAQQNLHLVRSVLRPLGARYEELGRDEAALLAPLRAKLGSYVLEEDEAKRLVLMAYTSAQASHRRAAKQAAAPQRFALRFWVALTELVARGRPPMEAAGEALPWAQGLAPHLLRHLGIAPRPQQQQQPHPAPPILSAAASPHDERLRSLLPHLDSAERQLLPAVVRPEDIAVRFEDVGGLEAAKEALREIVMLPLRHPKLFARGNLRRTTRGILLFGPPGTGKSMLAKALARESGAAFLNLSSTHLTSKWFGESEKFGGAAFSLARKLQPCVLFFDEVDALLGKRHAADHEASRRLQNELMSAWDGFSASEGERVVVLAATNRPFDLDEAVLRRLPKRILVDVPDFEARLKVLSLLLRDESLAPAFDLPALARATQGYTGSDLKHLCIAAAYEPLRELLAAGAAPDADAMRAVTAEDFARARARVRPSVVESSLPVRQLREWNSLHADAASAPPRLFFGFAGAPGAAPGPAPSPAPSPAP